MGPRPAPFTVVSLDEYRRKRDFESTHEPRGRLAGARRGRALQFVIQKHAARNLHYDFRLELDGVLKSWAVPKGPSLVPTDKRMAAQVEDHPLEYGGFEGVIPKGEYGGGSVVVWDRGTWEPIGDPHQGLAKGDLTFLLDGEKLRGRWHLVRMRARDGESRRKPSWLLIKGRDEEARDASAPPITEIAPASVLSGRDVGDVARDADRVWSSEHGEVDLAVDPSDVAGARRGLLPKTVEPQLATLVDAVPDGDDWIHELKLDGYRVLCRVERGKARLITRGGLDWTDRFGPLAAALAKLPLTSALLDGEAVVLDERGRSSFQALQEALGDPRRGDLHLFLFDLLHLDGYDLRRAALVDRKALLAKLLANTTRASPLHLSDHVRGSGIRFFEQACRSGVEGVVSKLASAPYESKRTRTWLKTKCLRRQELVVVGWSEPSGSRTGLGALLLGAHDDDGTLQYAGKVGTGFDTKTLHHLRAKLDTLARSAPAVVGAPRARGVHWVEPDLVAEIAFTEWTRDGKVRHPTFLGLREDKPASEVTIEHEEQAPDESSSPRREEQDPAAKQTSTASRGKQAIAVKQQPRSSRRKQAATSAALGVSTAPPPLVAEVAGVRLSTPDRVYFPELGVTKSELAQYYERMADRVLPGLVHRPLSLVRCPEDRNECFYQKRANRSIPEIVPRVVVKKGREAYAMVTDLPSLIALVQVGVLEFHVWGARDDRLDRPDLLIFDLDPDPAVEWSDVADTALLLRGLLEELGLIAFVRSTGGKGLHLVTPIERRSPWEEVKGFAEAIALQLVRAAPDRFTAEVAKAKRKGKIYIDWLRNDRESTAIASWSVRAREGAPVAATLSWDELRSSTRPVIGVRDAPARLALPDPWADFERSRRPLTRAMRKRVGS
jgi:bifunctional non-homologous end joining protein LigD